MKPIEFTDEEIEELALQIVDINALIIQIFHSSCGMHSNKESAKAGISSILGAYFVPHFGAFCCCDLIEQIATVSYRISKNHCFADGNKRTAFLVLVAFLKKFAGVNIENVSGVSSDIYNHEIYKHLQDSFTQSNDATALEKYIDWIRQIARN